MRTGFAGYVRPDGEEFGRLWEAGLVVLDTNVLLDLYRLSRAAALDLISTLEKFSERLWLPHRVASEFHRGRLGVIEGERRKFAELDSDLSKLKTALTNLTSRKHVGEAKEASIASLSAALEPIATWLTNEKENGQSELSDLRSLDEDEILRRLVALYEGTTGSPFNKDDAAVMCETAKGRYESEVPPGYKDKLKGGEDAYGDFFIWEQTLRHASTVERDVIFVTGDQKDDWWTRSAGKTVGPRPELIQEFFERTGGKMVYLYSRSEFAERASADPKTVEEVVGLERRDAEEQVELDHLQLFADAFAEEGSDPPAAARAARGIDPAAFVGQADREAFLAAIRRPEAFLAAIRGPEAFLAAIRGPESFTRLRDALVDPPRPYITSPRPIVARSAPVRRPVSRQPRQVQRASETETNDPPDGVTSEGVD